uniref:Ig-like domain-containing protein n=1 Tax=Stomoxys calcitrans TaxID=35570 RepID=A0A1I8PBA5_STOCA
MYYGESVQERGGSSNSWNNGSNMLLRHQHAVLIGFTLLIYSLQGYTNVQAVDQVITEKEGQTVVVPCPVNKDKCGELHSLNWFKGDNRIAAMLLDDSNVTSVAEGFEDRVSVEQNPFRLIIRNLEIADQDIYLCDTTYFIPIETCDNFNGHRVELKVLVPPSEMVIWDEKGDRIANGTVIGPMQERQMLNLTCVVRNTTPMPEVGWYRGSELLPEVDIHYDDKDGLFNVTVELYLKLTRKDLAHNIECRAKSAAIQNTLSTQFSIDLQVRPTNIHINGVEKYTVQGSKVVLTCSVYGARPPVNLTWYNSTQTIDPAENDLTEIRTKAIEQADGTFYTQSELLFNATRFENDKEFRCEAENIVVKMNGEKPFQALLGLEVFYPPVIDVNPLNATVNTGDSVLLYCDYVANPATLKSVLWYRNGVSLNVSDSDHYKGGNSEHVALSIRHAVKEDIGNYTCELTNEAGQGISEEQINLDVLYVPTVEVLMTPVDSVKESEEANVTLICKIIDANPPILTKVRWYANSTLLKELPDCEETKEDLCHIDPSKLLLESIGRGFFYNYSCEGYNDAGWGPRSEDKELLVLYEPGPATIAHFPLIAVKKKSVTFSCSVDDPGYPETNSFRWLRGGRASSSDTKDYTIEPVGLDSRTNYSCYAMNAGGKGAIATVNLEVHAPPFFIKNLPPYTGMLHTSRNANLTCRIECVPRCEISWLKDGVPIEKNDTRYFVKDKYMDASPATGDFESMLSVLHFNMSNWPNNKFDIEGDNANYTCISTGNAVGPGIKSATYFSIEYAPDNTTVSEEVVYVAEETTPGRVMCKSRANPEPTYEWHFNDKPLIQGSALIINTGMTRNESGRYTCVAFNKHGRSTAETVIDVQYKPRCEIERKEIDDQDTLICTAYGNPEEADFSWSIKAENESVEALGSGDSKTFKDKSYYVLKEDYEIARTYRCVANNTVGVGAFCEIEVAEQLAWWQRWDKPALIILVASILVLLLAVIIICCIIICICRRRRRQDKYRTDVSMSATHSVLSYQPTIPQLITGGNTVLPDTLKMPIMSSMLVPTLAAAVPQIEEHVQIPKTITTATQMTQQQETKTTTQQTPSANVKFTLRQNISNKPTTLDTKATPPSPTQTTTTSTTTTAIASTAPSNNSTLTTTSNHSHTGTRTATTTPTLSVRHCTQAPKSPPRWPLRPGVMVHVSSDTKENLAVNRMTLKPTATLANLTASTVNDSSMSSSTLNTSVSNNNSTQTTLLNVTGTDCGTGIPQNTATLGRGSGIPGRVDNFNAKQVVVDRLLANNSNNNNNNEQTNIIPTNLDCTKTDTKATKMMMSGEISLDLQTELRVMDAKQTGQGKQQEGIEIEKFTAAAAAQEKEICVDVTPRNDDEMGIQGTKKEICKKSRLERVEDFIVKIFFKRRRSSPSNTCRDSQRSHVGLLGGKFWKRPDGNGGTAIASSTSPFATEHRLKGIRSSGSVTYKKCVKTTTTTTTNTSTTMTSNSSSSRANETTTTKTTTQCPTNINTHLNNTPVITRIMAFSQQQQQQQQQVPQPQTQTQLQTQHAAQHPLPVSMISTGPSLNTNHPVISADPKGVRNIISGTTNVTHTTMSSTTNVTPSTALSAVSMRADSNGQNSSMRSVRKGILKAPTPPPRPPPPLKHPTQMAPQQPQERLVQRSSSLVGYGPKIEKVQIILNTSSCEVLIFTLRQNISNKPTTLDTKATPPSPTQTTTTSTTTTAIASTAPSNNSTLTTTSNHSHTGTRTATTTPTLSVRHCTQAPKSPPRWPLRPGVMVHVSSDTKENLAVNRMTLKPTATLANLTASTVNDSSMSSSTLNTSVSNNNSTQTTLLNVTGTDCGTGIPQNTATLGRGSGIPGRVDNFNAKQVVVDRLLANNSNNNNNNEQTNIIPTNLDCTKTDTKATKMMMSGEISLDLQTELRVMDAKQTGQGKQQEGIEIEKFTAAAAAQEKEICVDVTPRNDDEMGIQGTKKEICKKSRLERVEDFIVKIFFKRRRSSPSNTCRDSQRSHVGLLGGKFWKRPDGNGGTAIASSTSPFATEHRLKGIRSSGSVTYKKCVKTTTTTTTNTSTTMTSNSSSSRANETTTTKTTTQCPTNINTHLNNTPVITRIMAFSQQQQQQQQQVPQPQTQTQLQTQHAAQHPLPVSMISTGPSLNTNHPVISADPKGVRNIISGTTNVTHTTMSSTTNVTPSTALSAVSMRADSNGQNSSMRSVRKGILKAPTPPPRPPPPLKHPTQMAPQQPQERLVQRSSSLVGYGPKIEKVQIILNTSSCEVLI